MATLCPEVKPEVVVAKMWEITGHQTAKTYLKRLDPALAVAQQVAERFVWSSLCMGEHAALEVNEGEDEAFVRHAGCPGSTGTSDWAYWRRIDLGAISRSKPWTKALGARSGRDCV